jgi:hypothetical protein
MNRTDDELDRLMARGGLGGAAREQILDQVLDRVAPPRQPHRWRLWLGGLALVASAATSIVLVVRPGSDSDEFRAKGTGAGGAELGLDCQHGAASACPLGSTLIFRVAGAGAGGYLQAYAEPRDGGERVWYFSSESGAPLLPARDGTQVARSGVKLGPEHRPGPYRVHVVFSSAPLGRAALLTGKASGVVSAATLDLNVVPR